MKKLTLYRHSSWWDIPHGSSSKHILGTPGFRWFSSKWGIWSSRHVACGFLNFLDYIFSSVFFVSFRRTYLLTSHLAILMLKFWATNEFGKQGQGNRVSWIFLFSFLARQYLIDRNRLGFLDLINRGYVKMGVPYVFSTEMSSVVPLSL